MEANNQTPESSAAQLPASSAPASAPMAATGAAQQPEQSDVKPSSDQSVDATKPRGGRRSRKDRGRDLGRNAWSRQNIDKRARNAEEQEAKRRKLEDGEEVPIPIYATQFSKEEIDADQRKPKKKVAVLIGYSGSGYHGMQMTTNEKTIESDLFTAFVAAGAISKANAADPKKSSLVRCARTDKGVHAAGNVVSLKLIVEDPDVVEKINSHLSPQIRVWGYEVTNKSFSCYQQCDSRIYEYLIPSHCFLPPHPSTILGKKIVELAEKHNDMEAYLSRQEEVAHFWEETDNTYIKPLLKTFPEDIRRKVQASLLIDTANDEPSDAATGEAASISEEIKTFDDAIKAVRAKYLEAKKAYRIHPKRMERVNEALGMFVGTKNFHNYTIQKQFRDPSAKRHIKSFKISRDPIIINGSEWLSLKVHGQSFMMHQIRKLVAMAAMMVRCGGDLRRIEESYGDVKIAIPKAPGLGLLLERPIFDSYNRKAPEMDVPRNPIDFSKYEKQMDEFKQREIYERIFREAEETNGFSNFFNHIDSFQDDAFLYVTSGGVDVVTTRPGVPFKGKQKTGKAALAEVECESDGEIVNDGEEGG
ncbi:tRNA pseudouridine synthase [Ascosphaera apis ARSEF 7405]|uniref:tRNA pseudouridine synthase 1 n=1 Tax=Ascosphaera apis ARSEF 7405 TaxID=392613 RepID=A0A167VQQ8_9EURO|nr:tRNA pseudouridine synthase [Ascosphaera apis ARSEF 7405]